MPGLVPGIHVLGASEGQDVDGRDKPGHDVSHEYPAIYAADAALAGCCASGSVSQMTRLRPLRLAA
jgi:hypothetical protein